MFLGLGVNDAFGLASEFGHHTMLDLEFSIAKRVSRTACASGSPSPLFLPRRPWLLSSGPPCSLLRISSTPWQGWPPFSLVVYVRNALVAMGTPSLALPVLFIAVCLMALWHYPQQKSLGHVTVLQTQNFLLYEVSSESYSGI